MAACVFYGDGATGMKNKLAVLLLTPGLLASGAAAYAHHSFGSTYIVEKQVTLEGNVIQISHRSPHSFFSSRFPTRTARRRSGPSREPLPASSPRPAWPETPSKLAIT